MPTEAQRRVTSARSGDLTAVLRGVRNAHWQVSMVTRTQNNLALLISTPGAWCYVKREKAASGLPRGRLVGGTHRPHAAGLSSRREGWPPGREPCTSHHRGSDSKGQGYNEECICIVEFKGIWGDGKWALTGEDIGGD